MKPFKGRGLKDILCILKQKAVMSGESELGGGPASWRRAISQRAIR